MDYPPEQRPTIRYKFTDVPTGYEDGGGLEIEVPFAGDELEAFRKMREASHNRKVIEQAIAGSGYSRQMFNAIPWAGQLINREHALARLQKLYDDALIWLAADDKSGAGNMMRQNERQLAELIVESAESTFADELELRARAEDASSSS